MIRSNSLKASENAADLKSHLMPQPTFQKQILFAKFNFCLKVVLSFLPQEMFLCFDAMWRIMHLQKFEYEFQIITMFNYANNA